MPGKETTDAMFALRMLMEKYREGQRELHCLFVDLEKAYDRVSRDRAVVLYEKIRNGRKVCATCTRYVAYEASETMVRVRCAVGTTETFKVKVRLHQGSELSPFLFFFLFFFILFRFYSQST